MNITLYSTGCPKCKLLKDMLDKSGLEYTECTDVREMTELGLMSAPALAAEGRLMDYTDATQWVFHQIESKGAENEKQ